MKQDSKKEKKIKKTPEIKAKDWSTGPHESVVYATFNNCLDP